VEGRGLVWHDEARWGLIELGWMWRGAAGLRMARTGMVLLGLIGSGEVWSGWDW
jgi:hypothetical protein